jgi:hypothetical protein
VRFGSGLVVTGFGIVMGKLALREPQFPG